MKTLQSCLMAAVFSLSLGAPIARAAQRPDAWITVKVKSALAARKDVKAIGTKVDTNNGVVTLRGEVRSLAEKELAGRYAREVEGVIRVDNQLVVKGEERRERKALDYRDEGTRGTAPGDRALNRAGDAALAGRVKAALAAHRGTSAFRTNVDAMNGKVVLYGTARSAAEKEQAEKVVRGVEGVRFVDNRIEIQ